MNTEEGYYLKINGEQKGPYSLGHLRHLFGAGFINAQTLFWHEAYEEWQEVGLLAKALEKRVPRFSWLRPLAWLGAVGVMLVPLYICLPILSIAIKEAWQSDYTAEAAYWKARQQVREQTQPHTGLLSFAPFTEQTVALSGSGAVVELHAVEQGRPSRSWQVKLLYDGTRREWRATAMEPK